MLRQDRNPGLGLLGGGKLGTSAVDPAPLPRGYCGRSDAFQLLAMVGPAPAAGEGPNLKTDSHKRLIPLVIGSAGLLPQARCGSLQPTYLQTRTSVARGACIYSFNPAERLTMKGGSERGVRSGFVVVIILIGV